MVEVLGDSSSLERAFARSGRSARGWGRDVESASRGALAASLSFRGIGRSLTFASAQFLGGAGIVFALKSTIQQAQESQRVLGQTANAVQRAGQSWQQYGKQVEKAALAQANVSGFDDERLLGTFSLFVRRTKDVNEALRLNALAANVARGRNIELEQAAQLVLKASLGQAGALRRVGIDAKKGATAVQLIAQLQQQYANSAKAFGSTSVGAQARFNVALGNTQELIGSALLPTVTTYLNRAADWLNETDNQAKLQRTLTTTVKAATEAVKSGADAARTISGVFGGLRNTVEALVALKLSSVVVGWATSLTRLSTAAEVAAGRAAVLKSRLAALGAIGVITIGLEIILNRDSIDKSVSSFLDKSGLGFLTGGNIDLGNANATQVEKAIRELDRLGKGKSIQAKALSKALDKLVAQMGGGLTREDRAMDLGFEKVARGIAASAPVEEVRNVTKTALRRADEITLAVEQARLAIARGTRGAQEKLISALRDEISLSRKNQQIQQRLIANGVGNIKQHVAKLNELRSQEASALNEIKAMQDQRTADLKKLSDDAKQNAVDAAQSLQDMLQLRLEDAQQTRAITDDLKQLNALEKVLRDRIAAEGRTADLLRQLNEVRKQRANTRQFSALGLTPNGDEPVPGVAALRKQLASVSSAIEGSFLDTRKTQGMLSRIRRVLSGGLGSVTQEVRAKIRDMIAALKDELGKADGPLSRFQKASASKLTGGLGLTRDQRLVLRQRLAQVSARGTVPGRQSPAFALAVAPQPERPTELVINLDGREIARAVTPHQRKAATRRTTSRRGPHAGFA